MRCLCGALALRLKVPSHSFEFLFCSGIQPSAALWPTVARLLMTLALHRATYTRHSTVTHPFSTLAALPPSLLCLLLLRLSRCTAVPLSLSLSLLCLCCCASHAVVPILPLCLSRCCASLAVLPLSLLCLLLLRFLLLLHFLLLLRFLACGPLAAAPLLLGLSLYNDHMRMRRLNATTC